MTEIWEVTNIYASYNAARFQHPNTGPENGNDFETKKAVSLHYDSLSESQIMQ